MNKFRIIALLLIFVSLSGGYFVYKSQVDSTSRFPFRLGLDLSGGSHLVYQADVSKLKVTEIKDAMQSLRDTIERRVNLFGVSEPIVQIEGGGIVGETENQRLIVELPGVTDVNQAVDLIGKTAKMTFWEQVATISGEIPQDYPINAQALGALSKTDLTGSDLSSASVVFDPSTGNPQVQLKFNTNGAKKFGEITKETVGKPLAIVLDNIVI